jgi:hypothetical protein
MSVTIKDITTTQTVLNADDYFELQENAGTSKKTMWSTIRDTLASFIGAGSTVYKEASYAILDADGYGRIEVNTTAGAVTITLPLMANNIGRIIEIAFVKNDASLDVVTISPHATDANKLSTSGLASMTLLIPGQSVKFKQSSNSGYWEVMSQGVATYGGAPIYACRAWVNFDGTGTVAIRGSGNVSSITDGGTGIYTINYIINMTDTNYSAVFGSIGEFGWGNIVATIDTVSVGSLKIVTRSTYNATYTDLSIINASIFR